MYHKYSKELRNTIENTISQLKDLGNEKLIAAFDADGTLWPNDMGEVLFDYIIENKLVELPTKPWEYYQKLKEDYPPTAYLWLAQILKGQSLSQIEQWSKEAYKEYDEKHGIIIFESQKELVELFHKNKVDVYIVTASIKWAIEDGAKLFNIPKENVIGVKTKIIDGIITDIQDGPITWKEGKAEALLLATNKLKPFFSCGNTMGDISLLQTSSHLKLAVHSAPENSELFETEQELKQIASSENWLVHKFA